MIFGVTASGSNAYVVTPKSGSSPIDNPIQQIPNTYYGSMSFDGNIVIFCAFGGAGCFVYSWNSGSNQYVQAFSLSTWSGVTDMNLSPDGVYCCLIGYGIAQLYKKSSGGYNYLIVSITAQAVTFSKCDMSNNRVVYAGSSRIRIMNKQSNGGFTDAQNIDISSTVVSIKISYFNNWIFAGTSANELLVYTISGSSYYLYETITVENYIADIDVSYDAKTLLIAVFKSKFYIYGFLCTLIPHCITCSTGTFCD